MIALGRKLFILFVFSVLSSSFLCYGSAKAAQFSGAYLLYVCASKADGTEVASGGHNACQSYISGVIDYHNILKGMGTAPTTDFCLPKAVVLADVQKIVYAYIYKNRKVHSEFSAAPAVNLALHNAFPCKR